MFSIKCVLVANEVHESSVVSLFQYQMKLMSKYTDATVYREIRQRLYRPWTNILIYATAGWIYQMWFDWLAVPI